MTECERIIEQGILPESFFKEEEISGFLVTEARKQIWAIELDIFQKFAKICEQFNLRYFALYGTLLGAIRHKGMIPWDDDMDVGMPREDYDLFCKECVSEFPDPYLLQTPYSDSGYYFSFAKIRNKNTTCVSEIMQKAGFCQGIFLDIFPLDYCDPVTYEEDRKEIYNSIMKCSSAMKSNNDNLDEAQLQKLRIYHTNEPLFEYERIQQIAKNPKYKNSKYLGVPVNTILKSKQQIWEASDFSDYETSPFENTEIRIPKGYHHVLQIIYGDYMSYPPLEKRGTWHKGIIWDPNNPYKKYI